MSKPLFISDTLSKTIRSKFEEALSKFRTTETRFSFSVDLDDNKQKATLKFSELAYIKMKALVDNFDEEVAWHGTAFRGDEEKNEYIIKDILVYPQVVTGTTVNTDQVAYTDWLYKTVPEEIFNDIRMQGHSHVNMQTNPSSVDLEHQKKIVDQLEGEDFYIFIIWNKKDQNTIKIYDYKKNTLFEDKDIEIEVDKELIGLDDFVTEAKSLVKDRPLTKSSINITTGTTVSKTNTENTKTETKKKKKKSSVSDDYGYDYGYDWYGRNRDYYGGWGR